MVKTALLVVSVALALVACGGPVNGGGGGGRGGAVSTIASGQAKPWGLTFTTSHIVWTNAGDGTVHALPLASGVESVVRGQPEPHGITSDGDRVAWVNFGGGAVQASASIGGAVVPVATGQFHPDSVALVGSLTCWTTLALNGTINCANASGSVRQFADFENGPTSLIHVGTRLFWLNPQDGTLRTVDTAGSSSPSTLVTSLQSPSAIATDGTTIYIAVQGSDFFDEHKGSILSVPTIGGAPTLLASGESAPLTIAVGGGSVYWGTNNGAVRAVSTMGGAVRTIASGQASLHAMAVNRFRLYWSTFSEDSGKGDIKAVDL